MMYGMNRIDQLLKQVLDGSSMRHRALANNIANAGVEGYRRRDVDFISELKSAMKSRDNQAVPQWRPTVQTERRSEPIRMESEFAALAENQLLYTTSAEALSRRYGIMRRAILGR